MRLLAITRLTLTELRHSKLLVLPLTVAIALALVAANIENPNAYGDDLLLGTLSGLGVVGALIGILAASSLVSSEIERGTMLLLASRPVSRATIVLGKALGITIYLVLCALLWAATLAVGLGSSMDAGAGVAFAGAMLAVPAMLLGAMLALVASTLFPTRGAIGASLALWLAAAIVAAIPLSAVKAGNRDRVELAQSVLGWVLPGERLRAFSDAAVDVAVPASSWLALVVVGAWLAGAVVLLQLRRSLAR